MSGSSMEQPMRVFDESVCRSSWIVQVSFPNQRPFQPELALGTQEGKLGAVMNIYHPSTNANAVSYAGDSTFRKIIRVC
jgi:hypothetical protein